MRAGPLSSPEEVALMALRPPHDERDETHAPAPPRPTLERSRATPQFSAPPASLGPIVDWTWSTFRSRLPTCIAAYWGAAAAGWLIILTLALLLSILNDLMREPALFEFLRFLDFLAIVV